MNKFFAVTEDDTLALGNALGNLLSYGDFIALEGDLAAGKTTFSKGVAQGMGFSTQAVVSPTFTVMNVYDGKIPLRHFDLYRLKSYDELAAVGFEEYSDARGVTLVEWSELFPAALPQQRLTVRLSVCNGGREICFLPQGKRYEQLCQEVADAGFGD